MHCPSCQQPANARTTRAGQLVCLPCGSGEVVKQASEQDATMEEVTQAKEDTMDAQQRDAPPSDRRQ